MGEQVEVLKHHTHFLSYLVYVNLGVVYLLIVDEYFAFARCFKQIDTSQKGTFARAGGADNDHDLAFFDMLIYSAKHLKLAKGLFQIFNLYHYRQPAFRLPCI